MTEHIKTPVRYCDEDWMIFDADDKWLASLDAGEVGPEMVKVINYHDRLLALCKRVQELGGPRSSVGHLMDTVDMARALMEEMEL